MKKPCLFGLFVLMGLAGCLGSSNNEVVVYSALDKEFSQPILDDLGAELGVRVLAKYDQESNKTVGLVTDIIMHQRQPRTDIFWNNEILHTLRLQKLGLLETYRSPLADNFPDQFVSSGNSHHDSNPSTWHGFAARARVLIVNQDLIPDPKNYPTSIADLADPKWKGKCAIARPLFGTTATHAAVLFDQIGEADTVSLLESIAHNAVIVGGNKQVAQQVAQGQFAFGITDTDDAIIEIEAAQRVAIVFPDQGKDHMGTLLIPNTLCIIKNGPNPQRAKRLVDRLLESDIETRLANGPSAQIPLNKTVNQESRVGRPGKIMQVDFQAAADHWEERAKILSKIFPAGGSAK